MTWLTPSWSWHNQLHLETYQVPSAATWLPDKAAYNILSDRPKLKGVGPCSRQWQIFTSLFVTSAITHYHNLTGMPGLYQSWKHKPAAICPPMNEPCWPTCVPGLVTIEYSGPCCLELPSLQYVDPLDVKASRTCPSGQFWVASNCSASSTEWRTFVSLGLSVH